MEHHNFIGNVAILAEICQQCQLSPQDIQDVYPCTPLQSGIMVDSSLYIHTIVHKIDSFVDLDRLCGALDRVVAIHDVLRTRIVDCDNAGLLQVVLVKGEPVLRPNISDIARYLDWNSSIEMHLGTPLVRFAIVSSKDHARLVTTIHHALFDLHVLEFLMSDIWSLYEGLCHPKRTPFKDFVEHCNNIDPTEASAFWKKYFSSDASSFPPVPSGHQVLANEIITREISLSVETKKSKPVPSMALMPAYIEAAWAMTLSDYTNNDHVVFGYVLSGRGSGLPGGGETTFGPTITSVPVQVDLRQDMTIQQLVKGRVVFRREVSTSRFLQYGLAKIRNINDNTRKASSFQSAISIIHGSHTTNLGTSGLNLDEAYTEEPPKPHGLLLICTPTEQRISVKALFDPVVLDQEQTYRIIRQLEHRLRQLFTSAPSAPLKRLTSLNFGDRLELMDWNNRRFPTAVIEDCLHNRIASRAAEQPDELAVKSWDGEATYAELIAMVHNLAHEIHASQKMTSLDIEAPVCLIIGRSLSLVVAMLAVMRLGGTCVPVDPNLPQARKEAILSLSKAQLILATPDSVSKDYNSECAIHEVVTGRIAKAPMTVELPPDNLSPSKAAFIIFTSGSTGQPKGAVLEHRAFASTLKEWTELVGWTKGSRVLQYSAPSFDVCAGEIMGSLQAGACICIPSEADRESGLADFIASNSVQFVNLTPTSLRNLTPEDVMSSLKAVVSAGEPMPESVFKTWSDKVRLYNAWGPTEASVVASVAHITPDGRYHDTIGTPIGCALWIVDPQDVNRLLPIGAVGEMLIDGPGVAREYHLSPEQTKSSFIKPPAFVPKRETLLQSSCLYRSGDLARYNADGSIAFIGRRDDQVKIRGQRFELGEVEVTLARHPEIANIVVMAYQNDSGSMAKDLVAIMTLSSQKAYLSTGVSSPHVEHVPFDKASRNTLQNIRDYVKDRLASYMVPTIWLVVRTLPETPSKKVDRVKIRTWLKTIDISTARDASHIDSDQVQEDQILTPPITSSEKALQSAWSTVLRIEPARIGKESYFMRLGGDSITAMQVATRCRRKGLQIAVADLLRNITLTEVAKQVQATRSSTSDAVPVMTTAEESQLWPLSPIQKFLFENDGPASHSQFNQAFLLDINTALPVLVTPTHIQKALDRIVAHHSMLRSRFSYVQDIEGNAIPRQSFASVSQATRGESTWRFRLHNDVNSPAKLARIVSISQRSLDIMSGPVFSADVIIDSYKQMSLFLVAHHLAIDLVSWRILWEDLEAMLYDDTYIPPRVFPFPLWAQQQGKILQSKPLLAQQKWPKMNHDFWGMGGITPQMKDTVRIHNTFNQEQTAKIMGQSCNLAFNTTPVVLLLTAVIVSFRRCFPSRGMPALYCEGHGRDTHSLDTSRTIGWFTTIFPIFLEDLETTSGMEDTVMSVKDEYQEASKDAAERFSRQIFSPQNSSSFKRSDVELMFNFAGRMQQVNRHDALLKLRNDGPPVHLENVAEDCESSGLLSVFASIDEHERLTMTLDYNSRMAHQDQVVHWFNNDIEKRLNELISILSGKPLRLTASDLPLLRLGNSGPKNLQFLHSHLDRMGIAEDNVKSIYPCTPTQEGILFAQLNGHNYHNRFVATLTFTKGDISIDRVAGIWKSMCEAHDILRTIFTTGLSDQSAFQQIVLKRYEPSISFAKMPTNRMGISQVVETQEKHPLDPEKPQYHLTLYHDSASVMHAVLDISHTLADAKTFQDLWKTIGSLYTEMSRGHTGTVSPGRPFSDFVIWLQSQQEDARRYWTEYLQGVSPCGFPRDHVENMDYQARGPIVPFNDARLLNSFCQQQGVTNAMFMQAAWALVLRIHTDRSVVCFGSARSDQEALPRDSSTSDILGPLISILPSKFDLQHVERLTTKDVLETSRNDASIAMGYSGCHLAELHDELGLRDSPLFDTIMTIQRSWLTDLSAGEGDLRIDITDVEDPTEFSIVVGVQYSATDLTIRLSHQRGVVSDLFIERIATTFSKVIEYMIQNVDQPLINLVETSVATHDLDLLKEWNSKSPVSVMDRNVSNVFQAHAKSQPDAPAVCSWDGDLNYAELDRLSDLLAYRLRVVHGVRADDVVPFCCVKSKSAIVSMLAIWKAGAALLPLDFSHPAERLTTILDETKTKLVLINSSKRLRKIASCLPNGTVDLVDLSSLEQGVKSNDDVQSELSSFIIEPQHAGYLVYTSGSTGRPKGLVLHHQSLSTSSESMVPILGLSPHSRVLQLNNFVFDFGLLDVLFTFWAGACLCMPSEEEAASDVSAAIRRTRANYVECTPTYATLFNPEDSPTIKTVALGGEALKQENLDTWSPHARLMNAYGPGETGMSSCGDVAMNKDGTILQDIGRPGGCRYWVVNPDNSDELVPVGTIGELVIEGPIVGRGYVNNPQVQAASFVERPAWTHHPLFSGLELGKFRFYKSGDLVTQISKDSFVFAGRKDFQVKIRGQRMEIGEIEHQLNQQALGVDTWTVEAITRDDSQEQFLAAFSQIASGDALVCPNENHVLPPSPQTADAARLALQQTLPSYMVPEFFIPLRRIPTNSSMKTDRKALRGLVNTLSQAELVSYRATGNTAADSAAKGPTSPVGLHGLELVLQRAWVSLLNIQALTVQPTDDFFALGGNSIRAMRLAAALRTFGYLLSVVDIFKSPTLAGMSCKMTELPSHQSQVAAKSRSAIQSLKPRLDLLAKTNPWLEASNIAGIAPTTDLQALMLSEGYLLGSETHVATLTLKPTSESGSNSMDLARLTQACQNTIRRHAILRTVFIQLDQSLVQLALINPPVQQIHLVQPGGQHANGVSVSSDVLGILPKFSLSTSTNGLECSALTLRIHHAHYDAISMGIILNDLSNAYNATRTENQSSFLEWSSLIADPATHAKSYDFWRELLKGSMSYPLAPRVGMEQEDQNMIDLQHHAAISVPASSLSSLDGTEATVLKAAWACVLSLVLDKQDMVFSFLSANRFSSLQPHLEAQRLVGPCINLVPVRASLGEGQKSLSMIVKELQQQSNDSLAHQHVGFRSIVKNCTQWPTIRFNSTILFQNHGELGSSLRFGNTECIVEGIGNGTNSADVWITATPQGDGSIDVRLRFSLDRLPLGLCHWTVTCFESLLDLLPRWWDRDISDIHAELIRLAGPKPLSLVHNEDYASGSNGIDPEDPVHRALEARYFECN